MCIFLVGAAGIYEFNYYAIPIGGGGINRLNIRTII